MKRRTQRWTEAENALLRTRYPNEGCSDSLSTDLGRSKQVVRAHVQYLELHMTPMAISRVHATVSGLGSNHRDWRGFGRIGADYVSDLRRGAHRRSMECPILEETTANLQYLDSLVVDTCPLSGLPLTYPKRARDRSATASLDRIDPKQGYVRGNVRWIHKDINRIKWDLSDEVFLSFARDIAKTWPLS